MSAEPGYRHVQPYGLLWVLLPLAGGATALSVALATQALALLVAAVALPLALLLALGRLLVEVDAQALHWRFGWLGWPTWRVALADIAAIESTRAPAAAGSGIRVAGRARLYNVTIGGPALALTLRDGRRILIGTPEPARLAQAIAARRPDLGRA